MKLCVINTRMNHWVYGICESTFRKRAREAGATIKLGENSLDKKGYI